MAAEPNAVEQAVSRTLRDNLEKIQRSVDELHQAVNDMAAACASSRASNALPPMVRAQTSAASLSATLEVLSRLVTSALQSSVRMPFEPETLRIPSLHIQTPPPPMSPFEQPPIPAPHPIEHMAWAPPVPAVPMPRVAEIFQPVMQSRGASEAPPAEPPAFSGFAPAIAAPTVLESAPSAEPAFLNKPATVIMPEARPNFELDIPAEGLTELESSASVEPVEAGPVFNLDLLAPEEQELHRRAFRVAKVSMQDIRMLRPEDVRAGRENKDLCFRLRDDIEKAHKEYDRRFQSIQSHPVDYFYDWMVEILGGGDPQTLGEYPYPSAVLRR